MEYRWLSLVLLVAVGSNAASPGRILGGNSVDIQNWPFIVQVESTTTGLSWSQYCAGSILNNRFTLSAAQCFRGLLFSVSRTRLRAGTNRRGSGGVVVSLNRVFNHPNFSASANRADISILEQSVAWVWTPTIQAVPIFPQDYELPDNLPVMLAGWGLTREGLLASSSSTLQAATLQSVNRDLCAAMYSNATSVIVDENMVCTMSEVGNKDSCTGDEGGPVVYQDVNNNIFLLGVISWREGGCGGELPSVNTRVSSYTNWIIINASF